LLLTRSSRFVFSRSSRDPIFKNSLISFFNNYSLLPAFFTSVTLSDWKPLSRWMLHLLLHSSCRVPQVLRLNCLLRLFLFLPFSPSFSLIICLFSPLSFSLRLQSSKPITSPFLAKCDLFLSLSPRIFSSCPFLPSRDSREDPTIPNSSHLPFVATRLARAEISPYIKSGS